MAGMRTDWTRQEIAAIYRQPLLDLLLQAQQLHREFHPANQVQMCRLLSIKTGGCPEDCAYCPQSARYDTGLKTQKLMSVSEVVAMAQQAKDAGATRFCMGAAWRAPKDKDVAQVAEMVSAVNALGLESCATLGMLTDSQAQTLKSAGLDYYNHNLDTAPEIYG